MRSPVAAVLALIPDMQTSTSISGALAGTCRVFGRTAISTAATIRAGDHLETSRRWEQDQAGIAARNAAYERRADDWMLQHNLAAHELMQIGRQILASLIAEQIATTST